MFLGVMDDLCNPFLDESFNLYSLNTKVVVHRNSTVELMQVEDTGKMQLLKFDETRLYQTTCPITNTICKNNFKFFRTLKSSHSSKKQERLTEKYNVALFSWMYISCRN